MSEDAVEEKRNELNLEIRGILTVLDFIDGKNQKYDDYISGTMSENEFLDQQIKLAKEAKERLVSIFKD